MSKRKLYPTSRPDRLLFWGIIFVSSFVITWRWFTGSHFWLDWISVPIVTILCLVGVYLLQDRPKDEPEDYTLVISNIEGIGQQLSELGKFLRRERQRVSDSEATLSRLREEQAELEPVVKLGNDIVYAVVAAYSRATAPRVWKERAIGFISGLFASLLAAMVFEYLKPR